MAAEGDWKSVAEEATGDRVPPCVFRAVEEVFRGKLGAVALPVIVGCCGCCPLDGEVAVLVEAMVYDWDILQSYYRSSVFFLFAPFLLTHAVYERKREKREKRRGRG